MKKQYKFKLIFKEIGWGFERELKTNKPISHEEFIRELKNFIAYLEETNR